MTAIPADSYVETVFPDGRVVPARPEDSDSYRETARECGYGENTFRMCLHHELLHAILAEAQGLPYSPTIRAVAEGRDGSLEEESRVMQFQRRLVEVSKIPGWA